MQLFTSRLRPAPFAAALVASLGFVTLAAPSQAAVSTNNLRGTWKGPYVRSTDEATVKFKLVVFKHQRPRGGAGVIGAHVSIGTKTYKNLIGGFEPVTNIMSITQLPNPRNPRAPLMVFMGKVTADGKGFEASAATLATPNGANVIYTGTATR